MTFKDRFEAARKLAPKLEKYRGAKNTILLAIPRGSLQMGAALSKLLQLPLDIVVTKKIPAPGNEEYAIGSIAPDGEVLLNKEIMDSGLIPGSYIQKVKSSLISAIDNRYKTYRAGNNFRPLLSGKTVILFDDGIATGFTIKAAIAYLRRIKVAKIIVAVPVAAADAAAEITQLADEFICLETPEFFSAVGQFYENFPQVTDEEAIEYLKTAQNARMSTNL